MISRCQSRLVTVEPLAHRPAIVGPTPSVSASVSSEASRIASIEANWVARARAAVGPTWRIESATRTRQSGTRSLRSWRLASSRSAVGRELGTLLALLGRTGEERRGQQGRLVEVEQVALVGDRTRVEQGRRGLVAQALDVEGTAAGDVEDALAHLGRAPLVVGAAQVLVALLLLGERRAARGALRRHPPRLQALRPQRQHRPDDLGDDVAGLAQDRRCRPAGRPCA